MPFYAAEGIQSTDSLAGKNRIERTPGPSFSALVPADTLFALASQALAELRYLLISTAERSLGSQEEVLVFSTEKHNQGMGTYLRVSLVCKVLGVPEGSGEHAGSPRARVVRRSPGRDAVP